MKLTPFDFLTLALATWRLAFLLTKESGPFHFAERFRIRFPLGGLMTCQKCASVWCAAFWLLLWMTPAAPVAYVFALSGAALMLGSYTGASQS